MPNIKKIVSAPMENNTYLIYDEQGRGVLIDPSFNFKRICARMEELEVTPVAILLTHIHYDHIYSVDKLIEKFDIPYYVNETLAHAVKDPKETLAANHKADTIIKSNNMKLLTDNTEIAFGDDIKFNVYDVSGHSQGDIMFELVGENCIFTGDFIFKGTVGRTDFHHSSPHLMKQSINLIKSFEKNYILYSGHADKTNLDYEKKYNIYFN